MRADRGKALLAMSPINGLIAIRKFRDFFTDTPVDELIRIIRRVSPDDAYHDYELARELDSFIDVYLDRVDTRRFLREMIYALLLRIRPWWLQFAVYGRQRVREVLSPNELQCLESAGLLDETPDQEVFTWWDTLAGIVRSEDFAKRLAQGREAERLTLQYEANRLKQLGIDLAPRWIALENAAAGYDIISYDSGTVAPIARLIEVKSSLRRPAEIFLTRNEWETAMETKPNYVIHLWRLPERYLVELTPNDLIDHVPKDGGSGTWEIVRIVLPELP